MQSVSVFFLCFFSSLSSSSPLPLRVVTATALDCGSRKKKIEEESNKATPPNKHERMIFIIFNYFIFLIAFVLRCARAVCVFVHVWIVRGRQYFSCERFGCRYLMASEGASRGFHTSLSPLFNICVCVCVCVCLCVPVTRKGSASCAPIQVSTAPTHFSHTKHITKQIYNDEVKGAFFFFFI